MPTSIVRDEVRRLLESGAQIVDVLPPDEYELEHITGAVNIPLRKLTRESSDRLDRSRPVIVYCNDFL